MASTVVTELKARADAAWAHLRRQLDGLEPYLDRADAPGEWTAREVLSHLLGRPEWTATGFLESFATTNLPELDIEPGSHYMTEDRKRLPLKDFAAALEAQHRSVFAYLDTLSDADLKRKARIPVFKTFMGTDEIALPVYVGAIFDFHWNDHAGQLAKIRKAVGLPDAR
jgi:hypothetical protein